MLAPLVSKLHTHQPITVGVLGASVSLNGGCDQQPSRRCIQFDGKPEHLVHCYWGEPRDRPFKGFFVKFMEHVNATWPHPQHQLNNSAADTTPPQSYLDYCFFTHLPSTLDLVILEFGSMAASASFTGVEAIVRVLLSLRDPPALLFLTVREWCKASVKPFGSAPPFQEHDDTKHKRAELAFTSMCRHYNQTCLSYHEAIAPHFFARSANFSMADIAGDCLHPNRGRLGNEYMSDILIHWLRATVEMADAAKGRGTAATAMLPPPLYDSARVGALQAQTRNERCYGFGALGAIGRQRYQRLLSAPWRTAHCPIFASIASLSAADAPLEEACTHVDEAPTCPIALPSRHQRLTWMFCRSALTRRAASGKRQATSSKRQPGVLATTPGATLDAPLDMRLAEFSGEGAAHRPVIATLQYLRSPQMMGVAKVWCVARSGCSCAPQTIDAHNATASSGFTTHLFAIEGGSAACVVRFAVLNRSSSGGHAFKVRQVTLTRAQGPSPPASPSPGARGGGKLSVRRRVGGRQREMIKGSYAR